MSELLIVFVKNPELGRVKTRLAKDIGDEEALAVYQKLLKTTIAAAKGCRSDVRFYFNNSVDSSIWSEDQSKIQSGDDLGEKMKNAFQDGFSEGYERIAIIGSDLPDMTSALIDKSFQSLSFMDTVIGPASDGGYYLLGMKKMISEIFESIHWSTDTVLETTLERLTKKKESYFLLETKNDIDTKEDLMKSTLR